MGFVGHGTPAEKRSKGRDEHSPEQSADAGRGEDEMKVAEQAAKASVVDHAVHHRAQQRRLQSIRNAADQRNDAKQRARQRQSPRAYAGDARGLGGGVQAVDDPGQEQDDQQVRHGGRMSREATTSQATISWALILTRTGAASFLSWNPPQHSFLRTSPRS